MVRIFEMRLELDEPDSCIKEKCTRLLGCDVFDVRLIKKSIDARQKKDIFYSCTVECEPCGKYRESSKVKEFVPEKYEFPKIRAKGKIVIAGMGPSGMFAALMLARSGFCPIVIERGDKVENRIDKVDTFFNTGELDTETNIQFGEGGAGTFSDGKLNTGINDARIRFVLDEFVKFGASESILSDALPHIGTDVLREIVKNIRQEIISLGGKVMFNTKLTELHIKNDKLNSVSVLNRDGEQIIECDALILAIGHSSRDTFEMLYNKGLQMVQKPFSVGVRIEHRQSMINKALYGEFAGKLPPAPYKLWHHFPDGSSVYSFCMCPGGYVVNASSEKNRIVTNGMSNFARDGQNANSALLVNVSGLDGGSVFGGIKLQRELEERAFSVGGGNYCMPVQTVGDFLHGKPSKNIGDIVPTVKPGYTPSDFREIFPSEIIEALKGGIVAFDRKISGFSTADSVITAPETRSSSPVKVIRDKESMKTSIDGVFSAGEGGGHSGGIMSSAVDGIKNAEAAAFFLSGRYGNVEI